MHSERESTWGGVGHATRAIEQAAVWVGALDAELSRASEKEKGEGECGSGPPMAQVQFQAPGKKKKKA